MAAATGLTTAAVMVGYLALGVLPMLLFGLGYVGGLLWWQFVPGRPTWSAIRTPYLTTLGLFAVHKWEERTFDFFPALSRITGVPVPSPDSQAVIALYAISLPWLLVPALVWRRYEFGYYLAATFFMSMGTTELAHFVFPLMTNQAYGYFPGMLSVIALAPAAWWGLLRLAHSAMPRRARSSGGASSHE